MFLIVSTNPFSFALEVGMLTMLKSTDTFSYQHVCPVYKCRELKGMSFVLPLLWVLTDLCIG